MSNSKENNPIEITSYLSISNKKIIEALKNKTEEEIKKLGISEAVLFMIQQGYAKQLRKDIYLKLSRSLGIDISV
jgi:DNA-binding Xre family transcriptional regulator